MALLLKYRLDTGAIVGGWHSNDAALVDAQAPLDDPEHGYLPSQEEAYLLEDLQAAWYVLGGALLEKQVLTLTATPSPFPADGVSICAVTVSPFVACMLRVQGESYALTPGDPTLDLTSDVPESFTITVAPMAAYVVAPLIVEAV